MNEDLEERMKIMKFLTLDFEFKFDPKSPTFKLLSAFPKERLIFQAQVKKSNDIGWKNSRLIVLTDKQLLNTNTKQIKSSLEYKDINAVFYEPRSCKIIILNNPKVKNTQKYFFELMENPEVFVKALYTFSIQCNHSIKYLEITNPESNYSDLFFKNPSALYQKFLEEGTLKPKVFAKQITYVIDHENFIKNELQFATVHFQDPEFTCSIENFEISRLISNKSNYLVFLGHNSALQILCIFKVFKKWKLQLNRQENLIKDTFQKFKNTKNFL